MKHALQAKDYTPTLEDVKGDDIPTFPPEPKDLDLAKAIRPGLRPSPEDGDNIFTDGEVTYYCIEVERETRRTLASSTFVTSKVWCRTDMEIRIRRILGTPRIGRATPRR